MNMRLLKNSVFTLLAAATVVACGPKANTDFQTAEGPHIKKGTKTIAQFSTTNDELALALDEIQWNRRSAVLAVSPPSLSSREGCVVRNPNAGQLSLVESYDCRHEKDAGSARAEFIGTQVFRSSAGFYTIGGNFTERLYTRTEPETLVSQGILSREIRIAAPTGVTGGVSVNDVDLQSSVYKMTATSAYKGDVADESNHVGEEFKTSLTSGFEVTPSKPLKLLAGSQVTVAYMPEVEIPKKGDVLKRPTQTVQLTATTDVTFVENKNCLRPVGTFTITNGSTQVGTLTADGDGYKLSTDEAGVIHAWPDRCLEQ